MDIRPHFPTLVRMPLMLHHSERLRRRVRIFRGVEARSAASSAYRREFRVLLGAGRPGISISISRNSGRSSMNILKRIGLSGQPCLTPCLIGTGLPRAPLIETLEVGLEYRALMKSSVLPLIPILCSLNMSAWWGTVSNAFRKSMKQIMVGRPLFFRRCPISRRPLQDESR